MTNTKTRKMVGTALLAAIIVVLQTVASGIKIGPFTPTFSLIPIVIGAILYGEIYGAFLGLVFGIIVVINVLSGAEAMSTLMLEMHPVITVALCLLKGILAGYIPGLVYKALKGTNEFVATAAAAVLAPFINTGLFCWALVTFFSEIAADFAAALKFDSVGSFIMKGIVGLNFLFELGVNMVLTPMIARIIKAVRK